MKPHSRCCIFLAAFLVQGVRQAVKGKGACHVIILPPTGRQTLCVSGWQVPHVGWHTALQGYCWPVALCLLFSLVCPCLCESVAFTSPSLSPPPPPPHFFFFKLYFPFPSPVLSLYLSLPRCHCVSLPLSLTFSPPPPLPPFLSLSLRLEITVPVGWALNTNN